MIVTSFCHVHISICSRIWQLDLLFVLDALSAGSHVIGFHVSPFVLQPENLLRNHGLRLVTSSCEKREQALKVEKEKAEAEDQEKKENEIAQTQGEERSTTIPVEGNGKTSGNRISASTAYHIAASAASYLHSHTMSILPFKSSKTMPNKDSSETTVGCDDNIDAMNREVASFMVTSDSVTSVVAAKEEVKQAVADDLNSNHSSPCEWFVCDDDQSLTRFFVIQVCVMAKFIFTPVLPFSLFLSLF